MNKHFPDVTNSPAETRDGPAWAKGVQLTDEARESAALHKGHQRRDLKWVKSLAAEYTREAIMTLVDCLDDSDGRVRALAANSLLDRAWGKPAQAITGEGGGPVRISTEPGELHARIVSVVAEVAQGKLPGGAGGAGGESDPGAAGGAP